MTTVYLRISLFVMATIYTLKASAYFQAHPNLGSASTVLVLALVLFTIVIGMLGVCYTKYSKLTLLFGFLLALGLFGCLHFWSFNVIILAGIVAGWIAWAGLIAYAHQIIQSVSTPSTSSDRVPSWDDVSPMDGRLSIMQD